MKHIVPAKAAIPPRSQKMRVTPTLLVPFITVEPVSKIPVPRQAEGLVLA
jgi:hypothetical protein